MDLVGNDEAFPNDEAIPNEEMVMLHISNDNPQEPSFTETTSSPNEEASLNEVALIGQLVYIIEIFHHISTTSPAILVFLWFISRIICQILLWAYHGYVSLIDLLNKKNGTRFEHIKSTNLSLFMGRLCNQIFQKDPRYKGSLEAIGSEAEGIRVNTSDYDFLLVSDTPTIQLEKLEIKPAEIPTVRADMKSENNLLKSYFKVFFKDDVPEEWDDCTDTGSKSLNARLVQRKFAEALADIVKSGTEHENRDKSTSFTILNKGDNTVTLNGPAVSFAVNDKTNSKPKKMNIDITFAIPLNLTNSKDFWPLDGQFPGVELTDHVKAGQPIKTVHLVPAGDFWRLSFVLEERERMKKLLLDENKHIFMVALKAMRNSVSLTYDDESPLLSSYLLKWSFMMETCDTGEEAWKEITLGNHALSILDRVVQCGSTGSMTSFFLKEDPVLKDSDRSYLESRRILKLIDDEVRKCANGLGVCFMLSMIFALSSSSYQFYHVYMFGLPFSSRNNSLEYATTSTCAVLIPILPAFIFYGIMVMVVTIRAYAILGKVPQMFLVTITFKTFLLEPIFFLAIKCSPEHARGLAITLSDLKVTMMIIFSFIFMCNFCYRRRLGG